MGADIHMVLEKKFRDGWVGVNAFPYVKAKVYDYAASRSTVGETHWAVRDRNYSLFAALAGVRGDGPAPLGVPHDASDLALMEIERWGQDGHSHTWMTMSDALPIFITEGQLGPQAEAVLAAFKGGTEHALDGYMENFWLLDDDESLSDYRLILWFDN